MKIAVYTVITGAYDELKPINPEFKKEADFYLFTDNDIKDRDYEIMPIPKLGLSPKRSSRIAKLCPHNFLKGYDYYLYLDGSVELLSSPLSLITKYGKHNIVVHKHPARRCVYEEADAIVSFGFLPREEVQKQVLFLKQQGYPVNNGLTENGVILRKNNAETNRFNEYWWEICTRFTHRDQLSFCYCSWKLKFKYGLFEGQVRADHQPRPTEFLLYPHK